MRAIRRPRLALALFVCVAALWAPASAHALVMPMTIEDLARASDAVVVGRVVDATKRAVGSGADRPMIVTDYRIGVTRALKGQRPAVITVTQPGGTMGGVRLTVSDMPVYTVGEQCALFLDAHGRVVGGYQGKLRVEGDRVPALGLSLDGLARRVQAASAGRLAQGLASAIASAEAALASPANDVSAQATPVITSVSPANANAGIGETVTIAGSGFGAVQGSGYVVFNKGDSMSADVVVTAPVISWSDTSIVVVVPRLAEKWVRVTNAAGLASANFAYDCGFSTDGRRWLDLPVTYRINENTADMTGEGAQIQAAFATWNSAGSAFRLAYGGATTAVEPAGDGVNTIFFRDLGPGYLGLNYCWQYPGTPPQVVESDIVLNDAYLWGPTATSSAIDLQSVALHELGHTVGLDDQYEEIGDVMGAYVIGQNKRALSGDEIAGARYLYPTGATPVPAPTVSSPTHPDPNAWSREEVAEFRFSAAGATAYSYALDRVATTLPDSVPDQVIEGAEASVLFGPLADGDWYFHVCARGADGTWGPTTHYRARVDATAPSGTAQVGPVGSEYVRQQSVTVTLALSDAASGLAAMRTTANGGGSWSAWTAYAPSVAVTLPAEGTHVVGVEVRDGAGNVFAASRALVYDVTPPVTTSDAGARYEYGAKIDLAASDGVSGVGATYYGLDASPAVLYEGPVGVGDVGEHTLYWYSVDRAGNAEAVRSASFTVTESVPGVLTRLAGANRYDTAVAIGAYVWPGWRGVTDIVVACGEDRAMADPLAAAGLAGVYDAPILLVPSALNKGALPASVERAITTARNANGGRVNVHVVGGTAVVPSAVYKRLDALNGSGRIRRLAGDDRYGTSATVASAIVSAVGVANVPGVFVANGADVRAFYDALAVAPASAAEHRPLVLVKAAEVPVESKTALATALAGKPRTVVNSVTYVSEGVRAAVGASARIATSSDRVVAGSEIARYCRRAGWLEDARIAVANTLPDALAGGAAMGRLRGPLVYTTATALPAATESFITAAMPEVSDVYVLGGARVVSEDVAGRLWQVIQ